MTEHLSPAELLENLRARNEERAKRRRFLERRSQSELVEIAMELLEHLEVVAQMADDRQESIDAVVGLAISLGEAGKRWVEREREAAIEARRRSGAEGGARAALATREVRELAVRLAQERAPEQGWQSAPAAADAIATDVNEFARTKGRRFSHRKIEEWLRDAGIKRPTR